MLEEIKTVLGLSDAPGGTVDPILKVLIKTVTARLLVLIGATEVPEALQYIITEVVIARYNRIGSEGVSSHGVSGETMQWNDDDFTPYQKDIDAYRLSQASERKGKVRFL